MEKQFFNFGPFLAPISETGGAMDPIIELRLHFVTSNIVFKYQKDWSRETRENVRTSNCGRTTTTTDPYQYTDAKICGRIKIDISGAMIDFSEVFSVDRSCHADHFTFLI